MGVNGGRCPDFLRFMVKPSDGFILCHQVAPQIGAEGHKVPAGTPDDVKAIKESFLCQDLFI